MEDDARETNYGLYHLAPVYQVRRDMETFNHYTHQFLVEALRGHKSEDWRDKGIEPGARFELFRRDYGNSENGLDSVGFRWLHYGVESFESDVLQNIRTFFRDEDGRDLIRIFKTYLESDRETTQLLTQFQRWCHDDSSIEADASWVHHCLLSVYSSISTRGLLLSPIWDNRFPNKDGEGIALAYLVHVEMGGQEETPENETETQPLPKFVQWKVTTGESPDWSEGCWCKQEPASISHSAGIGRTDIEQLEGFFQSYLWPVFQYDRYDFGRPINVSEAHARQKLFGFIYIPVYIFHEFQGTAPKRDRLPWGDWVGVLQVKLFTDKNLSKCDLSIPSLNPQGLIELVRWTSGHIEPMADKLIESDAIRDVEGADTINEAFENGLRRSLGWRASSLVNLDEDLSFNRPIESKAPNTVTVALDWDPSAIVRGGYRVFEVSIPSGQSNGPGGDRSAANALSPHYSKIYDTCNRLFRSVHTLYQARQSRKRGLPPGILEVLDRTQRWFGTGHLADHCLPHRFGNVDWLDDKNEYKELIQSAFDFVPDCWFDDEGHVKKLHQSLKSLVGKHGLASNGDSGLSLGGLYILFLTILSHLDLQCATNIAKDKNLNAVSHSRRILFGRSQYDGGKSFEVICSALADALSSKGDDRKHSVVHVTCDRSAVIVTLDWSKEQISGFRESLARKHNELLEALAGGRLTNSVLALSLQAAWSRRSRGPERVIRFEEKPDSETARMSLILGGL